MNIPVGSTYDCNIVTSSPLTGAVVDLLTGTTLVNPAITVRQGSSLITIPSTQLTVTKVPNTTGTYCVSLFLDPVYFKPGRTYSIIASYSVGTTPVVREAYLIRVMAMEPQAGYPGLNFTGLWDAIVDGTKTFRDCMVWLCSLGYGGQTVTRYDKATNTKKKTMLKQDGSTLTVSTSTYAMDPGEGPDLIKVERS